MKKKKIADSSASIEAIPMLPAVSRKPPCKRHNNFCKNMLMLQYFDELERRENKGMKQKQCPKCKRWYFKDEY